MSADEVVCSNFGYKFLICVDVDTISMEALSDDAYRKSLKKSLIKKLEIIDEYEKGIDKWTGGTRQPLRT